MQWIVYIQKISLNNISLKLKIDKLKSKMKHFTDNILEFFCNSNAVYMTYLLGGESPTVVSHPLDVPGQNILILWGQALWRATPCSWLWLSTEVPLERWPWYLEQLWCKHHWPTRLLHPFHSTGHILWVPLSVLGHGWKIKHWLIKPCLLCHFRLILHSSSNKFNSLGVYM